MVHGRIMHGFQFADPAWRHRPTMYYVPESGIGLTLQRLRPDQPRRVGVVGLGVGTLAAYGRPGDYFRFYEINPAVIAMAQKYFTFLSDSQAQIDLVLGDARLSLEREDPQDFDVLVLDAFSGDSIPTHLLTREAFAVYRRHLKPDGVLAAHISNSRVDLHGVISGLAQRGGLRTVRINVSARPRAMHMASHWMLATTNAAFLSDPLVRSAVAPERAQLVPVRLWTDEYSNLLQVLK